MRSWGDSPPEGISGAGRWSVSMGEIGTKSVHSGSYVIIHVLNNSQAMHDLDADVIIITV